MQLNHGIHLGYCTNIHPAESWADWTSELRLDYTCRLFDLLAALKPADVGGSASTLPGSLAVTPDTEALKALATFADDTYLHQVITRGIKGSLRRFKDLPEALDCTDRSPDNEWRMHFHVPLNAEPSRFFRTTSSHAVELLEILAGEPSLCSHLEMETYTWSVLPAPLKSPDVVDQIEREYKWTLQHLRRIHLT